MPLNICPSPSSVLKFVEKIPKLFKKKRLLKNRPRETFAKNESTKGMKNETIRLGRTSIQLNDQAVRPSSFHNENIFHRRKTRQSIGGVLTYQIVIERIVKRFLLYYENARQGLEDKEAFEFKEVKQDISSLRFEISHDADQIDALCSELIHTMKIFNESLNDQFPYQEIQLKTNVKKQS